MLYQQNIESCFDNIIGDDGITRAEFDALLEEITAILVTLSEQKNNGQLPLLDISEIGSDLDEIENTAQHICKQFKHLVILGTGGSTLSGQALISIAPKNANPVIHFLDNVDPHSCEKLLDALDLPDTCFLTISKSGSTLETLAQFGLYANIVSETLGKDAIKEHFIVITDPIENPLRTIASQFNIPVLDHAQYIGGRFSVFTNVGLLPAAAAGLDIRAFRRGALHIIEHSLNNVQTSQPALGAAVHFLLSQKKIRSTVLMPYIDRLANMVSLLRQIWSESLGKNGQGTTPIKALGTLDHHSQLQLYLDGPHDKMFTLITLKSDNQQQKIPADLLPDNSLAYLHNRTMGDVMFAAQEATRQTLVNNQLPVRTFTLETLDEGTLGALMMHFILETIITAHLLKVDPFDQPSVEEGKILARTILKKTADKETT